jgi:hypothetical protein
MPDGRVLRLSGAGGDRMHHHLARVHANAPFDWHSAIRKHLRRVSAQLLLKPERGVERPLRMVLMRHRRAKQHEDAVTGGLHDVAVVAMRGFDHQLHHSVHRVLHFLENSFVQRVPPGDDAAADWPVRR